MEESPLMPATPGLVCVVSNFVIIMIIVFCVAFDHRVTAKSTGLKPTKNLLSDLFLKKVTKIVELWDIVLGCDLQIFGLDLTEDENVLCLNAWIENN